ncbi:uncharacterized protein B0I36DRAFT_5593 [Microdochium trichocladiopsis]|uniref:Uncharacterized protein n=1 Tax=Microdochium trichocladiopsis TaxID=1682393 RepID=A0A9P8YE27_9PEZI|nr:uncharacterized protein B0I36DRAFT_5593 [Microdochium trichocladiopsis]KAH7040097.1 hypothetical protein B0I36DRAFT_5593 [Microdochium trichocladiopsis]
MKSFSSSFWPLLHLAICGAYCRPFSSQIGEFRVCVWVWFYIRVYVSFMCLKMCVNLMATLCWPPLHLSPDVEKILLYLRGKKKSIWYGRGICARMRYVKKQVEAKAKQTVALGVDRGSNSHGGIEDAERISSAAEFVAGRIEFSPCRSLPRTWAGSARLPSSANKYR